MSKINNVIGLEVRRRLMDIEDIKRESDESVKRSLEAKENADEAKHRSDITKKQLDEALKAGDQVYEVQTLRVDPVTGEVYDTASDRFEANQKDTESKFAESVYYHEFDVEEHFDEISNTNYWITRIKHKDNNGEFIELKHGVTDKKQGESVRDFANRVESTVAINASTVKDGVVPIEASGALIVDGVILQDVENVDYEYYLGIKESNTLTYYPPGTTAQEMLDDGAIQALRAFTPLIDDSERVSNYILNRFPGYSDRHPRQVIAQYDNLDLLILTTGGKGFGGDGMLADDVIRILLGLDVKFAYMLDGGGSTQTVVRGSVINEITDGGGTKERPRPNFLYISKDSDLGTKKDISSAYKDIGSVNKKVSDLGISLKKVNHTNNLDDITDGGFYWATKDAIGIPGESSWGVIHYNVDSTAALQVAFPYDHYEFNAQQRRTRTPPSKEWGDWRDLQITEEEQTVVVDNLDNINKSGSYWVTSSAVGVPGGGSWAVTHYEAGGGAMQVAYPYSHDEYNAKQRRLRNVPGREWGDWRDI